MQTSSGSSFLADCTTRPTTEILADKWSVLVLFGLRAESHRHGELVQMVGGISRKVLTQTLRRLQRYGLVEREAEGPRNVRYHLTDLGRTLIEPIEVLTAWARDHGEQVVDFQERVGEAG